MGSGSVVVGGSGGAQMQAALHKAVQFASQAAGLLRQALRQHPEAPRVLVAGGGIFNRRRLIQVSNTFLNNSPNDVVGA